MLKITLNLIDPAEQKNIQKQKFQFIFKDIVSISFIVTAIISSGMLLGRNILEENYASILENASLVRNQSRWFTQEVSDINLTLQDAQLTQDGYFKWTRILVALSNTVPPDNQLTQVNISLRENKVSLKGVSLSRLALLAFKDALEQQPFLENISSPLSNLLQKENIQFEFDAQLIPENL